MAGRTAREAHDAFAHAYQRALLCVSRAHFNTEGHRGPGALHSADIGTRPAPLQSSPPLGLLILTSYRILEVAVPSRQWTVRLTDYYYTVTDGVGREVFAYHWHPSGRSSVTWPHLHLGPALGQLSTSATQAHFPTGPVAIEDVIRMAITWFGVTPQKPDWGAVLDDTRRLFSELAPSLA